MSSEYLNQFDLWNLQKQRVHNRVSVFCNIREIWWCILGLNIGSEQNGKNDIFERPVLIIKVFSKEICRIIPLTSSIKNDEHHLHITYGETEGSLILSQMKTISTKRLFRKMCRLDDGQFNLTILKIKNSLDVGIPHITAGNSSEPEGLVG